MIDEDTSWQKQLLVGVCLLLVVGLLVGGIIGLVALKAADVAGVGETQVPDTGPPPGLEPTSSAPRTARTPKPSAPTSSAPQTTRTPKPSAPTSSAPQTTRTPKPSAPTSSAVTSTSPTPTPPQGAIQLVASPLQATTGQQVTLSGTYQAPPGTTVQVQRNEGGVWTNFPIDPTTVNGGTFSTYIFTGRTGPNPFRVVDTSTGEASNVVTVQIS